MQTYIIHIRICVWNETAYIQTIIIIWLSYIVLFCFSRKYRVLSCPSFKLERINVRLCHNRVKCIKAMMFLTGFKVFCYLFLSRVPLSIASILLSSHKKKVIRVFPNNDSSYLIILSSNFQRLPSIFSDPIEGEIF